MYEKNQYSVIRIGKPRVEMEDICPNRDTIFALSTKGFRNDYVQGFSQKTDKFTMESKYVEPGDFGSVKRPSLSNRF